MQKTPGGPRRGESERCVVVAESVTGFTRASTKGPDILLLTTGAYVLFHDLFPGVMRENMRN